MSAALKSENYASYTSMVRRIHVARRKAGLDDDTYRDLLERSTGERSLRVMDGGQLMKAQKALERLTATSPRKLSGPYAGKLQALWIAGWNLGVVRDRRDEALLSFLERQTGIERTEFLRDAGDASKVVEALKKWLAREADVDWSIDRTMPDWMVRNGYRIAWAQFALLQNRDPDFAARFERLSDWIRATGADRPGVPDHVSQIEDGEPWQAVMNQLGELVRGEW